MFDRLLKIPWVLNKRGFWLWHGCICKCYAEFRICLIMVPYASMPHMPVISFNMCEQGWILMNFLNMPENARIKCSDYIKALNMPQYIFNNTIIITVIITEFLSPQFLHSGALLPFYLFQHQLEHKNIKS